MDGGGERGEMEFIYLTGWPKYYSLLTGGQQCYIYSQVGNNVIVYW